MSRKAIAKEAWGELKTTDAATTIANISRRGNGDQQQHRGSEGSRPGGLHSRALAGIPSRGRRHRKFPDVHEPDDRQRDGEAERNREGLWRTDHHGEAIRESVSGPRRERILRDQGA